jgi:hypothetical protein
MSSMEIMWVKAWGEYADVHEELRGLFGSPSAQVLVREFAKKGFDPEILAFAFIMFVMPVRRRRAIVRADDFNEGRRRVEALKRWLQAHGQDIGLPDLHTMQQRLDHYRQILKGGHIRTRLGNMVLGEGLARGHPKKERAKRRVVFLLVGYFAFERLPRPNWLLITKFLTLTGLASTSARPKTIATWWSNISPGPSDGDLVASQRAMIEWFETTKADVHGQSTDSCLQRP